VLGEQFSHCNAITVYCSNDAVRNSINLGHGTILLVGFRDSTPPAPALAFHSAGNTSFLTILRCTRLRCGRRCGRGAAAEALRSTSFPAMRTAPVAGLTLYRTKPLRIYARFGLRSSHKKIKKNSELSEITETRRSSRTGRGPWQTVRPAKHKCRVRRLAHNARAIVALAENGRSR
jgi:hypothetical protein